MDFAFSPRVQVLQAQVQRFMDDLVLPSNRDWQRYADAGYYPSDVVEPLKATGARRRPVEPVPARSQG
jgi:acyl-CoA dehydrogenase